VLWGKEFGELVAEAEVVVMGECQVSDFGRVLDFVVPVFWLAGGWLIMASKVAAFEEVSLFWRLIPGVTERLPVRDAGELDGSEGFDVR